MSPSITDVAGVRVGHAHDLQALTGCTVVLTTEGAVAGVDVRGGAPGTRETDLLAPTAMMPIVHGIALCGGSAFGLAAATGVMEWMREHDVGFSAGIARVPILPAAVIFDLLIGRSDRWADADMGYAACEAASADVAEGCVGIGVGATVGKLLGAANACKSGVGTWSETLVDGTTVGAFVVCNAWGDVYRDTTNTILVGTRDMVGTGFANSSLLLRQVEFQVALQQLPMVPENTTLAVIATDAELTKTDATKLAQMSQNGLARTIRPVHTPFDGDAVFALATGRRPALPIAILGTVAADVLAKAVERAVLAATPLGGLPTARELSGENN